MSRVLSRYEAAQYLNVGLTTLWRLTKSGDLTSIQIGTRRLYREEDLTGFLETRLRLSRKAENGTCSFR